MTTLFPHKNRETDRDKFPGQDSFNMPKTCIMILLDGLGDRSYRELDNQTPLQAARTPVLDRIAGNGANGLFHPALLGQALPSENAHFAMLGYDKEDFPGRGALEALGAGIPLNNNEVAILAHYVTVSETDTGTLVLTNGKPEISADEISALNRTIRDFSSDNIEVCFHHTQGFRGILTLTGNVTPFVTDSDPMREGQPLISVRPWRNYTHDTATRNTATIIIKYLKWVYRVLCRHPVNTARLENNRPPVNALVTQRAGRLKKVVRFPEYLGLRGISIASGIVYHGLATYLGIDVVKVKDTDRPGEDLAKRIKIATDLARDYDFIHVHTKAPDEAAHTKDPIHKTRIIEELDQGIGTVLDRLISRPEQFLVITADHSTPSSGPLIHSGEPVPLIFYGKGVRRDNVQNYNEINAAGGSLGLVRGKELMYLVLNHLDRAKLHGIMDMPVNQPYWPGQYDPLCIHDA